MIGDGRLMALEEGPGAPGQFDQSASVGRLNSSLQGQVFEEANGSEGFRQFLLLRGPALLRGHGSYLTGLLGEGHERSNTQLAKDAIVHLFGELHQDTLPPSNHCGGSVSPASECKLTKACSLGDVGYLGPIRPLNLVAGVEPVCAEPLLQVLRMHCCQPFQEDVQRVSLVPLADDDVRFVNVPR